MRRRRPRPQQQQNPRKEFIPRAKPIEAQGGIKAESRAGDFGKSWWAKRWQDVEDSFRIGGRLARGRRHATKGPGLAAALPTGEASAAPPGWRG